MEAEAAEVFEGVFAGDQGAFGGVHPVEQAGEEEADGGALAERREGGAFLASESGRVAA